MADWAAHAERQAERYRDGERRLPDAADAAALEPHWRSAVQAVFDEATLAVPTDSWMQGTRERGGKQGVHTEHLSHMLAVMQSLPRAHPNAQW